MYGDPGFHKHVAATKMLGLMSKPRRYHGDFERNAKVFYRSFTSRRFLTYSPESHTIWARSFAIPLQVSPLLLSNICGLITDSLSSSRVKTISHDLDYDVDFSDLEEAVSSVQNATCSLDHRAQHLTKELSKLVKGGRRLRFWKSKRKAVARILLEIRAINKKRRSFESGFLSQQGIKDREWYRHKGTAPGKVSVVRFRKCGITG
jgi:hypothetical protein